MVHAGGPNKDRKFTFMLDDDERAMLEALAVADDRTASDWLRRAIRLAHAEKFGDQKGGKPARKPKR